jgi:hypothetical protein
MNLKSKIILLITIFSISLAGSAYSQGLFKNNNNNPAPQENTTTKTSGLFAESGKPKPDDPDGPGEDGPYGESPVGEGLVILSLLSGGYFMLKRRKSKNAQ